MLIYIYIYAKVEYHTSKINVLTFKEIYYFDFRVSTLYHEIWFVRFKKKKINLNKIEMFTL